MKVREAFKNADLVKNLGIEGPQALGVTSEGIKIRFFLEEVEGGVRIMSAFPWKEWLLS